MANRKTVNITIDDTSNSDQCFVADGYERAIAGIEAEVRPLVEQKYANELNASSIFKRWFLLRRMEREVADLVAEQSVHVAPDSLF